MAPAVLPVAELERVLWPTRHPTERARRMTLMRLRRRLAAVDLALRCQAGLGYSIEVSRWPADPCRPGPSAADATR